MPIVLKDCSVQLTFFKYVVYGGETHDKSIIVFLICVILILVYF